MQTRRASTLLICLASLLPYACGDDDYSLTVSIQPAGAGTVDPPGGSFAAGSLVRLTATPNAGYRFVAWGGDAAGSAPSTSLTMDGDKQVSARFEGASFYLLDLQTGPAAALAAGASIDTAPPAEAAGYLAGTLVTLTPVDGGSWRFGLWSGPDVASLSPNGAGGFTMTIDGDKSLQALFVSQDVTLRSVSIAVQPPSCAAAGAAITRNPLAGAAGYPDDSLLLLTPQGTPDCLFAGWSGAHLPQDNGDGSYALLVDRDIELTAHFGPARHLALTVEPPAAAAAGATVAISPYGLGGDYGEGAVLSLRPMLGGTWAFIAWSGDAASELLDEQDGTWTLLLDADKTLTAGFSEAAFEDFESGGFELWQWRLTGNVAPQLAGPADAHAGLGAVQFGASEPVADAESVPLAHGQTSELYTRVLAAGGLSISFWYRVSSERNYDKLEFGWDDHVALALSGEQDWTLAGPILIPAGQRRLFFRYAKDGSLSRGQDSAWLDDIALAGDFTILPPLPALRVSHAGAALHDGQTLDLGLGVPGAFGGSSWTLILGNQGEAPLHVSGALLDGQSQFSLALDPSPTTIDAGTEARPLVLHLGGALHAQQYQTVLHLASDDPQAPFTLTIGCRAWDPIDGLSDDFESGDLSRHPWVAGGDAAPHVQARWQSWPEGGSWAVQFGDAESDAGSDAYAPFALQRSSLALNLRVSDAPRALVWRQRVSSAWSDVFTLWVDDELVALDAGSYGGWSFDFVPLLRNGVYRLRWEYLKDQLDAAGYDCAWLDGVVLGAYEPRPVVYQDRRPLADGGSLLLGAAAIPGTGSETRSFWLRIANDGLAPLTLLDADSDERWVVATGPLFDVSDQPSATELEAFESSTFAVSVAVPAGTTPGLYSAVLAIDTNAGPYRAVVTVRVEVPTPAIEVELDGTDVLAGDELTLPPRLNLGRHELLLRVRNSGTGALLISDPPVVLDGSTDFELIGTLPNTIPRYGGSETVTLRLPADGKPAGLYTTGVWINSLNDPHASPFFFTLRLELAAPVVHFADDFEAATLGPRWSLDPASAADPALDASSWALDGGQSLRLGELEAAAGDDQLPPGDGEHVAAVLDLSGLPAGSLLAFRYRVDAEASSAGHYDEVELYFDDDQWLSESFEGAGGDTDSGWLYGGPVAIPDWALTLTIRYAKDLSLSAGRDCAWIDELRVIGLP